MRVEIGEIEIIAEHGNNRPSNTAQSQDAAKAIEDLRRELAQYVEALVREEFRRRSER